jgi:predicted AAA+ superfamily ATPase
LYPFSLAEPDPLSVLRNILDTVLQRDIPGVAKVTYQDVVLIGKVLRFIGLSAVDGVNPTTIAKNFGITRYKAIEYVDLLSKAFILIQVDPEGKNVLREPKILMQAPYRLLYRSWDDAVGALREDFFATAMNMADMPFHYLKSTTGRKTPDFWLTTESGNWVVEIGGPGKGRTQFKGVKAGRKMVLAHDADTRRDAKPLFMAGYLA